MIVLTFIKKYILPISVALGLIFIFLWFKGCGKPNHNTDKPIIVSPKKILDSVTKDEEKTTYSIDSLNGKITYLQNQNNNLQSELIYSKGQESDLAQRLKNQPQPIKVDVDHYITISEKRDSICDSLNVSKDNIIENKDKIIADKDTLYSHIRTKLNELADQSQKQINYENTIKPKNQLYIGAGIYGDKLSIIQGAEIGIQFKNKKDAIYQATVKYDFNNQVEYGLSRYFKIHLWK